MAAKACPVCGLKSPGRALHCDCGHEFNIATLSTAPRPCPQCKRVWPAGTPLCKCGHWFDEDAQQACELYKGKKLAGTVMIVSGLAVAVLTYVAPLPFMLFAGGLVVLGARNVTVGVNGLRSYQRPRHDPDPIPPKPPS